LKVISKAPRGALFTVVALALGCLIAACGSTSSSSSASNTSTTASAAAGGGAGGGGGGFGGANPARRAALVACLKQHGVTLPSRPPGAGGGGGASGGAGTGTSTNGTGTTPRRGFFGGGGLAANPKLRAAFQACGAKFGFGGGARFRGTLARASITKYVTCVRQHGYNLPNPNFSGQGPVFPANIQSNAKFQAASRACQNLLVRPRPGGSGGGTSTTAGA
jgi:hypothetical protein